MNNFFPLYRYEIRKILAKRSTVIVLAVAVALMLAVCSADRIIGGGSAINKADSALHGRAMDDGLLSEMRSVTEIYSYTDDYGMQVVTGQCVYDPTYEPLFNYLRMLSGNSSRAWDMTEARLDSIFTSIIDDDLNSEKLTDAEKAYWAERRDGLTAPPVYGVQRGLANSVISMYMINSFSLIAICVTVAGVFSDEKSLRTDALIYSSRNGKKRLAGIKWLAGLTVGVGEMLLLGGICIGISFALYGTGGADTSLQIVYGPTIMDMTVMQGFFLCVGILLVLGLLYSSICMGLSQLFMNSLIPIAAAMLLLLLSMLNVPYRYRVLSQLFAYLPATFPGSWIFSDYRLVTLFGLRLNILQVMPLLYVLLCAVLCALTLWSYRRYQVNGR